jgi:hypothetical protein
VEGALFSSERGDWQWVEMRCKLTKGILRWQEMRIMLREED